MQPSYWSDSVYYKLERGKQFRDKVKHLHDFTMKVIRERKEEMMKNQGISKSSEDSSADGRRLAFMDLMLKHHINGGELTEEDIREEVDTFMFEGHDTTAMAMSWILYLLGHNMEVQDRLALEVDSLFADISCELEENENKAEITLDKIKQLKYLDCVVKEGLRLCPSVPLVGRKIHQDMEIKGYKIPASTIVYCFIYQVSNFIQMTWQFTTKYHQLAK